jgi:hypothetical protein
MEAIAKASTKKVVKKKQSKEIKVKQKKQRNSVILGNYLTMYAINDAEKGRAKKYHQARAEESKPEVELDAAEAKRIRDLLEGNNTKVGQLGNPKRRLSNFAQMWREKAHASAEAQEKERCGENKMVPRMVKKTKLLEEEQWLNDDANHVQAVLENSDIAGVEVRTRRYHT